MSFKREKREREEENKTTQEKEFIRLCIKYFLCPICHIGIKAEEEKENFTSYKYPKCSNSYGVIKHITPKLEEIIR